MGLLLAACGTNELGPAYEIADLRVPVELANSLADVERSMFFDIVALGAAIAREETAVLGDPIVRRLTSESLAYALPYALVAEAEGWSEAQLREAYDAQPEYQLEVRHMVRLVEPGDAADVRERARTIAREVADRAWAGEDFATLAAEFSEEPGAAERGGLLQPGRQGNWVDAFWSAASSLGVGQVSDVVESPYGFHVIRLDRRTPVPLEEASRTAFLTRVIPGARATELMEEWAAGQGAIDVSVGAAEAARQEILEGREVPDTLVLARGAGGEFTGAHLAAAWALLQPPLRATLETDDGHDYAIWVAEEARVVLWASAASARGLDVPPQARADAELIWLRNVARWSQALGLTRSLPEARIVDVAYQALLSGTPDARGARQELRSLRPRLRALYPVAADF